MRKRFRVSGEVQGVGFRYFTRRVAIRLGLAGWVQNRPDGSVEAVADGPPGALAAFARELRRGPSLASVSDVLEEEIQNPPETLKSFEIR